MHRSWKAWVGFLVSAVALVITLHNVRFDKLVEALGQARLVWLLPASVLWVISVLSRARRWSVLMGGAPLFLTLHAQNIGYLLNSTLPFRLGELARAYVIGEKTRDLPQPVGMARAMSSIIVERVLDLATVVAMFAAFAQYIPMPPAFSRAALMGGGLVLVLLVVGALFVSNAEAAERKILAPLFARIAPGIGTKVLPKLHEVTEGFRVMASPRKMATVLFHTAIVWGANVVFTYLMMRGFLDAHMGQAGLMLVVSNLGGAVPSAPGGLGIVQGFATTALVIPFHVPEEPALAFVLVWSLGQQLVLIGLGLVSLARIGMTFSQVRHVAGASS